MSMQTRFAAAALTLIAFSGIAGCSEEQSAGAVVSEAYAAPLTQSDYGWRTPASASAVQDGNVYEYQ
jgi:hypothetical protein